VRAGGTSIRNIDLFRELVGSKSFKSVMVVTTWWDEVKEEVGERRWQELQSEDLLFKKLLDGGGQIKRHTHGSVESAEDILRALLQSDADAKPTKLQIQSEMGDFGRRLYETRAARALANGFNVRIELLEKHILERKARLDATEGDRTKKRLKGEIKEDERELKDLRNQQQAVGHSRRGIIQQIKDDRRIKTLVQDL
jgi:hypothetical protein